MVCPISSPTYTIGHTIYGKGNIILRNLVMICVGFITLKIAQGERALVIGDMLGIEMGK